MDSKQRQLHDAKLGAAIDDACKLLPGGYTIRIELENGCGRVVLEDLYGNDVEFTNDEGLADCIRSAIQFAKEDNEHFNGD